ncbi:MAG: recombination mediator RecR [Solobacterium sp.]|jgi:recombination protein RecR|nr:recombination mediator RecR [Solobacterium sp.]MCH4222673.1 recombination mediator RecR [Solobacterium sp.]MCH4265805.1 recombination mediator RecR [Solobacterium sp.]
MYPTSLENLIECFRRLPGVGEKTAERYALLISEESEEDVRQFADALIQVKAKLTHCSVCGNLSEESECEICKDTSRNHRQIFVVASPRDVIAMERTNEYHGVYHVLNGLISSSKGIMPEHLNIDSLVKRAAQADEIILATNATIDGETTSMYLDRLLKQKYPNILITRIAHGLPSGGMLDYADEMTLTHALTDRRKMGQ